MASNMMCSVSSACLTRLVVWARNIFIVVYASLMQLKGLAGHISTISYANLKLLVVLAKEICITLSTRFTHLVLEGTLFAISSAHLFRRGVLAGNLCSVSSASVLQLAVLAGTLCSVSSASSEVRLWGAGASFPKEVYEAWINQYRAQRQQFVPLDMRYEAVGSSAGKQRIMDDRGDIDYAGSDTLLTDQNHENFPDLNMFPTMAGAVVLGYHLPGVEQLNLTRQIIVGIYDGTCRFWNDSTLVRANPTAHLPPAPITVVARMDKSGTTSIFTQALSSFSAQWAAGAGTFSAGLSEDYSHPLWPDGGVHMFGRGNRGVSGLLLSLRFTIGYISVAEAQVAGIPYAHIVNRAGRLVQATRVTVQSAMDAAVLRVTAGGDDLQKDLTDQPGPQSYPINGYTYLVVRLTGMPDCAAAVELYQYVDWFVDSPTAARMCEARGFTPVSPAVAAQIRAQILGGMKCGGDSVSVLVEDQLHAEEVSSQTWRVPVYVTAGVLAVILLSICVYVAWHQFQLNKAVLRNEWFIQEGVVQLLRRRSQTGYGSSLSGGFKETSDLQSQTDTSAVFDTMLSSDTQVGRMVSDDDTYVTVMLTPVRMRDLHTLNMRTKRRLLWMRDSVGHPNIVYFYGLTQLSQRSFLLSTFCKKGRLADTLHSDKYNLTDNFKFSIACDAADGMLHLHRMRIVHGNLSTATCYIDDRWNVKIGDWQLQQLTEVTGDAGLQGRQNGLDEEQGEALDPNTAARRLFYTAPELVAPSGGGKAKPTRESDVYSFAIMLVEIFTLQEPYSDMTTTLDPTVILERVLQADMRPQLDADFPAGLRGTVTAAWAPNADVRPTFVKIRRALTYTKPTKKSVLDCMMEAMDGYVNQLEERVDERTSELRDAMSQFKALLHKMLPATVADALSRGETVAPELFDSVTIFFSDIVGFTNISSDSEPIDIVNMLNDLYTVFDDTIDRYDVYKIETIGDAYMLISGLPERNGTLHAVHIADVALELAAASCLFRIRHMPSHRLQLRVGIHSGPVCAGVVGLKMPRYTLFGDTVNTASRMESNSLARKIQVSDTTAQLLKAKGGYDLVLRGEVAIKGKGVMRTYWLHGKLSNPDQMPQQFRRDTTAEDRKPEPNHTGTP